MAIAATPPPTPAKRALSHVKGSASGKAAECNQKFVEQEAPKIGTHRCSTKEGVQNPFSVELALNHRELVKTVVFEKGPFEPTTPLK